jgi:uncharacterized protein with ATP-grasp and redox domains
LPADAAFRKPTLDAPEYPLPDAVMKTHPECFACLMRTTLDAARRAGADDPACEEIVRAGCRFLSRADTADSPPVLASTLQAMVRERTGCDDPYAQAKARSDELAASLLGPLRDDISASPDPFAAALRVALAGNIIDFGVGSTVEDGAVVAAIEAAMAGPPSDAEIGVLRDAVRRSKHILYLLDNAGEIVLDGLFLEQFPPGSVTCAVKGGPILNDATREDARRVGMPAGIRIIDNGTRIPGTVIERTGAEFRHALGTADLIVSKGQGNFETLDDPPCETFFLLRVKCTVVSRLTGADIGTPLIVRRTPGRGDGNGGL